MFTKFYLPQIILLLFTAFILNLYLPVGGDLDHRLIMPYIDPQHGFYLKNFWWYDRFAHHDLKLWQEMIFLAIIVAIFAKKYNVHILALQDTRPYLMILAYCAITTTVIGIIKHYSNHSCPWSILDLHTQIQFIPQLGNGGCFPGGHSGLGYAWCAGFFAFYKIDKRRAYFYLFAGIILGTGMGLTQMMRGAHFLSHNLWTFWMTWAIGLSLNASNMLYSQFKRATQTKW